MSMHFPDTFVAAARDRQLWKVDGEPFELDAQYKVVDYLGAGAYGVVCAAYDEASLKMVAIKKCKQVFHSRTLAKRTLRELCILRHLNHTNIVKLLTILPPSDFAVFDEIYLVFEIMETDLASIIRSSQPLTDRHLQYFSNQIFTALQYMHQRGVVHRDLKPRNMLVNSNCALKLADFGLARACGAPETGERKTLAMTEYVTTRWYRAPEVLVGWPRYSSAVDIWAAGIVMAELALREPLFPGPDSMRQMSLITNLLGKPSDRFISQSRKPTFRYYMRELPSSPTDTYRQTAIRRKLPGASPLAIDLIDRLLVYEPDLRMTASDALKDVYFVGTPKPPTHGSSRASNSAGALSIEMPPAIEEFSFDRPNITIGELRNEMLAEVLRYHQSPTSTACSPIAAASCIPVVLREATPPPQPTPTSRITKESPQATAAKNNKSGDKDNRKDVAAESSQVSTTDSAQPFTRCIGGTPASPMEASEDKPPSSNSDVPSDACGPSCGIMYVSPASPTPQSQLRKHPMYLQQEAQLKKDPSGRVKRTLSDGGRSDNNTLKGGLNSLETSPVEEEGIESVSSPELTVAEGPAAGMHKQRTSSCIIQ